MKQETAESLRLVALIYGVSAGVNYLWEMGQMPLYADMSYRSIRDWAICFSASLGDGVMTLVIYLLGVAVFKDRLWPRRLRLREAVYLLLAGAAVSIPVELLSLATGRWRYSPLMPVVPFTGIGFAPLLQMLILPPVAFRAALCIIPASGDEKRLPRF